MIQWSLIFPAKFDGDVSVGCYCLLRSSVQHIISIGNNTIGCCAGLRDTAEIYQLMIHPFRSLKRDLNLMIDLNTTFEDMEVLKLR